MKEIPRVCSLIIIVLLIAAGSLLGTGCALPSADENASDIPWNTPASWEGTPGIPGLNGNM